MAVEFPSSILIIHNRYIYRGGEDAVVNSEVALLRERGHDVRLITADNRELSGLGKLAAVIEAHWAVRFARRLAEEIGKRRPDVIHVHNFFPQISPAVFWCASRQQIPSVMTLHNFRLMCPGGLLLRGGEVCEKCLGRLPLSCIVHRCYRGSLPQSLALVSSLVLHRLLGTFRDKVTLFIALNSFCREKFIAGGLPQEKIVTKPNFVAMGQCTKKERTHSGLFVGRLSSEKGVNVLLAALEKTRTSPFMVIGDGPLKKKFQGRTEVDFLGWRNSPEVYKTMQSASYLVLPSIWYENFPRTIVEAFACGLPVIASRLGAMADIIEEGKTGLLFTPGSAEELAQMICYAESHPSEMRRMGDKARQRYEELYTPERNYQLLMDIYVRAIGNSQY